MRWKDERPTEPPSVGAVVLAGAVALFALGALVLAAVGARVVF